jgi:hypothetical protein
MAGSATWLCCVVETALSTQSSLDNSINDRAMARSQLDVVLELPEVRDPVYWREAGL